MCHTAKANLWSLSFKHYTLHINLNRTPRLYFTSILTHLYRLISDLLLLVPFLDLLFPDLLVVVGSGILIADGFSVGDFEGVKVGSFVRGEMVGDPSGKAGQNAGQALAISSYVGKRSVWRLKVRDTYRRGKSS